MTTETKPVVQTKPEPRIARNGVKIPIRGQCSLIWIALDEKPALSAAELAEALGVRPGLASIIKRQHVLYHSAPAAKKAEAAAKPAAKKPKSRPVQTDVS